MTRVIYIMGAARSGSTILGIVLGNVKGVFYAGELDAFFRRRGASAEDRAAADPLWSRIGERMSRPLAGADEAMHREFEHPVGLLLPRRGRRRRVVQYTRFNRLLYDAIAEEAGCNVVVDSSHYPMRRWNLRRMPSVELLTIYLVRDPRAVVASLGTDQLPKRRYAANAYLWVVHALSEAVFSRLDPHLRIMIKYEDLLDDPAGTVRRICSLWCLDADEIRFDALATGPIFAGNRVVQRPFVALRPTSSAVSTDRATRWLQLPWLRRYGYRVP